MKRSLRALVVAALACTTLANPVAASATPLAGPRCDFNKDGRSDLAIGVPGESVGSADSAGSVNILYGGQNGLSNAGNQILNQLTPSVPGAAEVGDSFGASTACGDFNADGFSDLAVGVPREGIESASAGGIANAGAVNVLYGSASGLTATNSQIFSQDTLGVPGDPERGDEFGSAVAAGDFNGDGRADLAVGVPGENVGSTRQAGVVNLLYGSATGLSTAGSQLFDQGTDGVEGTVDGADAFGGALASGDFNGDGKADLAVGVPGETIEVDEDLSLAYAGSVNILYGSTSGITTAGNRLWNQGSAGIEGLLEEGDVFGTSLATGDFNGDGRADLAIGAPGENSGESSDTGGVNVIYGGASGLSAAGNQLFTQPAGLLGDGPEAGDHFGTAVAAGDFDGNGRADLAVGAEGEDLGSARGAGAVSVLYGSGSVGLRTLLAQTWGQGNLGIQGLVEEGDAFGSALATGDFNGSNRADLAIGVPGEAVGSQNGAGAVNVLYGTALRLIAGGNQIWHQDSSGVEGVANSFDRFGGPVVSNGHYRVPYADGTSVYVSRDHLSHAPTRFRLDLVGVDSEPDYLIAAARTGVIKYIVDSNEEPTKNNNYVWIEHPDGEWSKYTHFQKNSVTSRGHKVGDPVTVGTILGLEGDVGQASGDHLHFEVAVPDDLANPISGGGFIQGLNRIPQICGIPGGIFVPEQTYVAAPC